MKLFKYNHIISTYAVYAPNGEALSGDEVTLAECTPEQVYDMYVRGEITFIQCRRLLKELNKELPKHIANEFKIGGYDLNIDVLTEYFCKAQSERYREFMKFLTFCRFNDEEVFIELLSFDKYQKAYVYGNEWDDLYNLTNKEATIEYINENLKN